MGKAPTDLLKRPRKRKLPPEIAAELVDARPHDLLSLNDPSVVWRCATHKRTTWAATIAARLQGVAGCPRCSLINRVAPKVAPVTAPALIPSQITIFDQRGEPVESWSYDRVNVINQAGQYSKVGHHILVIDRSGSMWSEIGQVRALVKKLVLVDSFVRSQSRLTLISYSGDHDTRLHFEGVTLSAMADFDSRVDSLHAGGLTCCSGALQEVLNVLQRRVSIQEKCVVTLHSDGYSNDPSPASERSASLKLAEQIRKYGAVLNTVAHGDRSDFATLDAIARDGGGTCVQASDPRAVYDVMLRSHDTALSSTGVTVGLVGSGYLLAMNSGSGRVSLSTDSLVAEVGDEVYTLHNLPGRASKDAPPTEEAVRVMLGVARGLIAAGRVSAAKAWAFSTGTSAGRVHSRAMTPTQVATMARDLQAIVSSKDALALQMNTQRGVEPQPTGPTVMQVLRVLEQYSAYIRVDLAHLMSRYNRVGLRRVPGRWVGGAIEKPAYTTRHKRAGGNMSSMLDIVSVDVSNTEAAVNLKLSQPVELLPTHGGPIDSVSGVSLEGLTEFKSYTIVSGGELRAPALRVSVSGKSAYEALRALGVLRNDGGLLRGGGNGGEYVGGGSYLVSLGHLPLTDHSDPTPPTRDLVVGLLADTFRAKLLSASVKSAPHSELSREQVAALAEHHITPNLNFSPPTCYPYPGGDVKEAQVAGYVDARVRYRVTFGVDGVLSSEQIPSGDEFAARRFLCGDKPATAADLFQDVVTLKPTAKMRLGAIDALCMPIAEQMARSVVLHSHDQRKTLLKTAEQSRDAAREKLREVMFTVGVTGIVPDSWGKMLTADELEKLCSDQPASAGGASCSSDMERRADRARRAGWVGVKVPKPMRDGAFYLMPDGVLVSLFTEESLYDTGKLTSPS